MPEQYSTGDLETLVSTLIAQGRTGNLRAVMQILGDIEQSTKTRRDEPKIQRILAEAYRHAMEPLAVAKKFKDVEQKITKIEQLLKTRPKAEDLQEIFSEALAAAIFHYIKSDRERAIHKILMRLGGFASNHQGNPFVQFNYAASLSQVAEYCANKKDREVLIKLLWEMIGIATFYPGKEILVHVATGILECISMVGNMLSLADLEELATRIDEFVNFTNDFDIQQTLTASQGKIFQYIAGLRMRDGFGPDGKPAAPKKR